MKRFSSAYILFAGLLCAAPSTAQRVVGHPTKMTGTAVIRPLPPKPIPCPHPMNDSLVMSTPTPYQQDFSAASWSAPRAGVGSGLDNHQFLQTFRWDSRTCCQVLSATLTVRLKAIDGASSRAASDAGNDALGIARNGVGVPASGTGYIWPIPSAAGATITKTVTFNAAQLVNLNTDSRLSFVVEDDTAVLGATLTMQRCCLDRKMS